MREKNRERAEALIGTRHGKFEIIALKGQNPTNQAVMVMARCLLCHAEVGPCMAYEITSQRKKSHRDCTGATQKDDRSTNGATSQKRTFRIGGRKTKAPREVEANPKPPPISEVSIELFNREATPARTGNDLLEAYLIEEARTLRRAAVAVLKGAPPTEIAEAMRRHADILDEVIYG